MQTRTYGELFKTTSALIGTGGQLAAGEQHQLSHFINRRFQQAFDESPVWPRYFVPSEKRKLSAFALAGSIPTVRRVPYGKFGVYQGSDFFTPIDTVGNTTLFIYKRSSTKKWQMGQGTYSQSFFQGVPINQIIIQENDEPFIQSDTKDYASPLDVPRWISSGGSPIDGVLELDTRQVVPYSETEDFSTVNNQSGRAQRKNIGDFNRIHRKEAFLNNSTSEYDFYVDTDGANVLNVQSGTDFVFVSYKEQFTPFNVTADYYGSTAEVPAEFFNYIAHAAYADFLRVQNRQEQAMAEEQVAQTYLALELEKIDIRSNNNTINKRFSTYVNRQAR